MTIGRRLNQMIHGCAAISMSAYALAAEQPGLFLIVLAVLGLEFAFVSRVGKRHLPRWVINTALAFATIVVIFELMTGGEGREFVSVIGRYIIWLQFIKLAEPKTARNLGQALALTAMLAVGAVLTNVALIVGLLLLIYIPLFLASVVVFQLYAGHVNTYGVPPELGGEERRIETRPARPARTKAKGTPPPAPPPPAIDRVTYNHWSKRPARGLATGSGLARNLTAAIGVASAAILAGSIALFIVIPRGIGESFLGSRIPANAGGPQISGFSPDLQLGGTGVISESSAIALYIRFSRAGNIIGSPDRTWHLRGYVMDRYNASSGRWIRSNASDQREHIQSPVPWQRPESNPRANDLVQDITIRNNRSEYLFSVFRPLRVEGPDGERLREEYIRPDGTIRLRRAAEGLIIYTVRSREAGAIPTRTIAEREAHLADLDTTDDQRPDHSDNNHDAEPLESPSLQESQGTGAEPPPVTPVGPVPDDEDDADEADEPDDEPGRAGRRRRGWQFQEGRIAGLANNIAEQAGITLSETERPNPGQIRQLATAIETHLAMRCRYTLDQPAIDPNADPIEEFLFATRAGHCEYFASASAALAAAMRIPSRVVTGFHVSEWDPANRRYIVRESSAHAWAEVEVEPGHWIVIDPSAEDVRQLNRPPTGLIAGVRRLIDQIEFLWVSRVVTFDSSNQRELVAFDFSTIREWLERINQRVAEAIQPNQTDAGPSEAPRIVQILVNTLVIGGSLTAVTLVLVLAARFIRRSAHHTRARRLSSITDPAMRRRLRFYETMLHRLDKLGHTKPDWQPPARHARSLNARDTRHAIERLTTLYYADRFGGHALTETQRAEAEQLLRTLDNRAKPTNHRP